MADPTILRPQAAPAVQADQEKVSIFKVELDDRCLLFPDGKVLQHLLIGNCQRGTITLDGVFVFNRTHRTPRVAALSLEQAREFARELVNGVYQARSSFVLDDTLKISINVQANGYHIEILSAERRTDLFLSTGVIWRVIKALLMAVDGTSPVVTN